MLIGGIMGIMGTSIEDSPDYFFGLVVIYFPTLTIIRRRQLGYTWKEFFLSIIPFYGPIYMNSRKKYFLLIAFKLIILTGKDSNEEEKTQEGKKAGC
jgi:uncharacterized membrane protein YhaH (DUF805 family)